ncbi:MAG: exodeoxyribonuclease VII large subunit [Candidatus Eremiobacteraeota bacterium]|nr:exodeoxyribonuclease VII large subunit [Candidatus Eremiobacteraeota bacterium]
MLRGTKMLELSVGEFSRRFSSAVAQNPRFQRIAIIGEITEIRRWKDGNLNLVLKEGEAILGCFSFASEARRFPALREGLSVRAEGSIEIRPTRAIYQLRAISITLVGEGKLAAEIEELRVRLRAEGAFDGSRKRPIPAFPRRVALVTSNDDARADFEGRIRADAPYVEIVFFPSRVQGKGAEIEIAEAMDRASRANVDVIVLTRGGGSSDDRLTFNLEPVARAILRARHPVVTAVGHLRDTHIADEVADLAVATPTAAAVALAQEWRRAIERLQILRAALGRSYGSVVATKSQRSRDVGLDLDRAVERFVRRRFDYVAGMERRLERLSPGARVAQWRVGLARANGRLDGWAVRRFDRYAARLGLTRAALDAEDPTRPLARGFAIITKDGEAVRDAGRLAAGDVVAARLSRGTFDARVETVHP